MELYSRDFHKNIENDELPQAARIAQYIKDNTKPKHVIDFGCSTGLYLHQINMLMPEIDFVGYEFSQDAKDNALCDNIIVTDLTQNLDVDKKENTLGLCLEVLEHIDDKYWKDVLLNITKLSDKIIFSAAHPGQGGTGHINCRPKLDWIRRFHQLGWVVDHDSTTHFLDFMKSGYHMGWLRMNVFILVKS
jgi:hypothetical protein